MSQDVEYYRNKYESCINCKNPETLAKRIKRWPNYCPVCGRPLTEEAWEQFANKVEVFHSYVMRDLQMEK